MPSLVDSFLLEIGLDASKFEKGNRQVRDDFKKTKDSLTKDGKEIEGTLSKTGESVTALTRGFQGLFGLLMGGVAAYGIKNFIQQITSTDSALGRLAANLNMQPGPLQAWGLLVERIGGNAREAQASILGLSDRLQSLKFLGQNLPQQFFMMSARAQRHGGPGLNLFGRGVQGTMEDIAGDIQAINRGEGRQAANFWGRQVGLSPDIVNVMIEQGARLKQVLQEVQSVGANTADIDAAKQRQEAWTKLEQTVTSLGRKITSEFTPAMVGILGLMQKAASYSQDALEGSASWLSRNFRGLVDWHAKTLLQAGVVPGGEGGTAAPSGRMLAGIADAVQQQEGFFPGSRAYRNNNPGNVKYGPLAARYGATGQDSEGHAIFPDYATGRAALEGLLQRHSGESLAQIGSWYAKDKGWASGVGAAGGMDIYKPLNSSRGPDLPNGFGFQGIPAAWMGANLSTIHNSPVYNSGSSVQTNFNAPINVQTMASDPEGIADFLRRRFVNGAYGNFANDGAH